MDDRFILERRPKFKQEGTRARLYVDIKTYETLADAAITTGKTMREVAERAIAFAFAHLEYIELE